MKITEWIAQCLVFSRRVWRKVKMYLFLPAFKRHGKHIIYDPDGHYTYASIEMGDDVSIGTYPVFMASESKIIIGSKVLFAPRVTIIGGNHNSSVVGKFMYDVHTKRPEDDQDVIIEDDVWVGAGVIILKGVRLGRGCIIAAGAVVNRSVPPYAIAAGVPARVKSVRFKHLDTILAHELPLYPPEKRLSREEIQLALGEYLEN